MSLFYADLTDDAMARDFERALARSTIFTLDDDGTLNTVVVCLACNHAIAFIDRESALPYLLDDTCGACGMSGNRP